MGDVIKVFLFEMYKGVLESHMKRAKTWQVGPRPFLIQPQKSVQEEDIAEKEARNLTKV